MNYFVSVTKPSQLSQRTNGMIEVKQQTKNYTKIGERRTHYENTIGKFDCDSITTIRHRALAVHSLSTVCTVRTMNPHCHTIQTIPLDTKYEHRTYAATAMTHL